MLWKKENEMQSDKKYGIDEEFRKNLDSSCLKILEMVRKNIEHNLKTEKLLEKILHEVEIKGMKKHV